MSSLHAANVAGNQNTSWVKLAWLFRNFDIQSTINIEWGRIKNNQLIITREERKRWYDYTNANAFNPSRKFPLVVL